MQVLHSSTGTWEARIRCPSILTPSPTSLPLPTRSSRPSTRAGACLTSHFETCQCLKKLLRSSESELKYNKKIPMQNGFAIYNSCLKRSVIFSAGPWTRSSSSSRWVSSTSSASVCPCCSTWVRCNGSLEKLDGFFRYFRILTVCYLIWSLYNNHNID